jgi:RNA polymerase sigma factor (sigma-70 family)
MNKDHQLLRRFVRENAQEAFAELYQRYQGMVYGAALRQTNGNEHDAEEIAQAAYLALAKKAPELLDHPSLGGWLHRTVRFLALGQHRAEFRRRLQEEKYQSMTDPIHDPQPEPIWADLAPVLDEALAALKPEEQTAIILRYIRGLSLAEVGLELGLGQKAAFMRVDRALDKLRLELKRLGITAGSAGLAATLAANAWQDMPLAMARRILEKSLAAGAESAASGAAASSAAFSPFLFKLAGVAAFTLLCLTVLFLLHDRPDNDPGLDAPIPAQAPLAPAVAPLPDPGLALSTPDASGVQPRELLLTVLAAETGQPVADAQLVVRQWVNGQSTTQTLVTDGKGFCAVPFSPDCSRLRITSQFDGLADTTLHWRPELGDVIPEDYLLHLKPALLIGGMVVDSDGNPVADARVSIGHDDNPELDRPTETHWFGAITASSGHDGRWQIHRIAAGMLPRAYASVYHPEYIAPRVMDLLRTPNAAQELRERTHQIVLRLSVTIHGIVVDPQGEGVSKAKVFSEPPPIGNQRTTVTESDGTFTLKGLEPGLNMLSVHAESLAPITVEIEFQDQEFYEIHLDAGSPLAVRVVNQDGDPIPDARIGLALHLQSLQEQPLHPFHILINGRTDDEGRFIWKHAPDAEHIFDISADGYMQIPEIVLAPSPQEHLITLANPLTIHGLVTDAATGDLIPRFRIIPGIFRYHTLGARFVAVWRPGGMDFLEGEFRWIFTEPAIVRENPKRIFRFEAEGYLPHVTRLVDDEEGEVRFDVALQRGQEHVIQILTPDWRPADEAQVVLISSQDRLSLFDGRLHDLGVLAGGIPRLTDEEGHFRFMPGGPAERIVVVHAAGYGEIPIEETASFSPIILQPWATVRVQLKEPKPPETRFRLISRTISAVDSGYLAAPDANNQLLFEKVPPGRYELVEQLHFQKDSVRSWRDIGAKFIDVAPGDNEPVEY